MNHVPPFLRILNFTAPEDMLRDAPSQWEELKAQIARHPGTVVVSAEIICGADVELGRRIIAELNVPDTRVVLTLRSIDQLLPSTWQEYVKAGDTIRYDDWLDAVFSGPSTAVTSFFWITGNLAEMTERWTAIAGRENLSVIVLNPRDQNQVYRDFESVIGLPDGFLVPQPDDLSNRSMTAAESEFIRRLNVAIVGDRPGQHGYTVLPLSALWTMLRRGPSNDEPRLTLSRSRRVKTRKLSQEFVRRIEATGAHIVGDLSDLVPSRPKMRDRSSRRAESMPIDAAVALAASLAPSAMRDRTSMTE